MSSLVLFSIARKSTAAHCSARSLGPFISAISPHSDRVVGQIRTFRWIEYVADDDELEKSDGSNSGSGGGDKYDPKATNTRGMLTRGISEGWVSTQYSAGNYLDRIEDSEGIKPPPKRYEKPTAARRKYISAQNFRHARAKIERITQWIEYEKGRIRPP
eukprot:CAMPEP_0194265736 /NCGR_PEP_ID=MMETSP0169-20130528/872_1 /TAXON_ID=218684 /ORGANISM="Corethron pennatum, Strain L29A3" /LENGTH=158 /DNA_ID=CAMNT_0039006261 /DNA_START=34 /DNA_END=510 /DNA_ORIENTATION=+